MASTGNAQDFGDEYNSQKRKLAFQIKQEEYFIWWSKTPTNTILTQLIFDNCIWEW